MCRRNACAERIAERDLRNHGENQSDSAGDKERCTPAPCLTDPAAKSKREHEPGVRSHAVGGHRCCAPLHGKQIRDQRMRGWVGPPFADTYADARGEQLPVVAGEATRRRHRAEYDKRPDNDARAIGDVRQSRDQQAHSGKQQRERKSRKKTERRITQSKFGLDWRNHDRENLPIQEVNSKDCREQR